MGIIAHERLEPLLPSRQPPSQAMKMHQNGLFVVNSHRGPEKKKMVADLEEALELAGVGKYQILHCAMMLMTLGSAILEMIGIAFILPAAACDLQLPQGLKGIITSVPNIGVILTAAFWGHAADTWGRKPVLMTSCACAGVVGLAASFMPTLLSYALCKLVGSLFLACPTSLGFAYASELVARRRRDLTVLTVNGLLNMSSIFSPLLAWLILATDWHYLVSWRLLTAAHATPLIIAAVWLLKADESPKYLMTRGKTNQALDVLRRIFETNTGLPGEVYCVTSLKTCIEPNSLEDGSEVELTPEVKRVSALTLLKPPHLKWLSLTGFLMFGLFSLLNGLYLFAPDTINKVMMGTLQEEGTICVVMNHMSNATSSNCVDTISHDTFTIMVVTTFAYGVLVLIASLCPLSKKTLLVAMYTLVGGACLLAGTTTHKMVAGAAMSALQLTSLGIGPLTAYAVHLFPTSLRGTAVGAVLMFGRIGSVVGANAAGYLLSKACSGTFYGFTGLLFLCAALSYLLPNNETSSSSSQTHSRNVNTHPDDSR